MYKQTLYNLENLFKSEEAIRKAKSYFALVKNGQTDDYQTPLWGNYPKESRAEKVLSEWQAILDANKYVKLVPGLMDFEAEMKEKVGPMSVMLPLDERLGDIENYYSMIQAKSQPIEPRAVEAYLSTLSKIRITPYDFETTINNMRLSTSSGVPFFARKRKVIYETKVILYQGQYYIAILGWRGQEGGPDIDDIKQRVIWMFPFAVNIRELSVYTPLIQQWQANGINSAYISIRAVEEKITQCFDTKDPNEYVICTDFSKFDQHFNYDLQNCAQECLNAMLPTEAGKKWLRDVFPIKYEIPIAISDNLMWTGHHGMGSGSGGTNFDECCAHSCLQHEAALLAGEDLNPYSNAYGDDGYLTYPGIDVDHIIECYTSHGQEMNPDKQNVSKDSAVYLRRYFHESYRDNRGIMLGIYATFRALGRLLYQERYYRWDDEVEYKRYIVLRCWSILENCAHHPAFYDLVDFVIKGDEYQLGLKIPGFIEGFEKDFNRLRELDPDVLGFTKEQMSNNTGVADWKIYKYLKSKK